MDLPRSVAADSLGAYSKATEELFVLILVAVAVCVLVGCFCYECICRRWCCYSDLDLLGSGLDADELALQRNLEQGGAIHLSGMDTHVGTTSSRSRISLTGRIKEALRNKFGRSNRRTQQNVAYAQVGNHESSAYEPADGEEMLDEFFTDEDEAGGNQGSVSTAKRSSPMEVASTHHDPREVDIDELNMLSSRH